MKFLRRLVFAGLCMGAFGLLGGKVDGAPLQRNGTGSPVQPPNLDTTPSASPFGDRSDALDAVTRQNMAESRAKALNVERQRLMVKESDQLAQSAADLQAELSRGDLGKDPGDLVRQLDSIERLAHSVKERMKGTR